MERRDFLKSSAFLGITTAGGALTSFSSGCNRIESKFSYFSPPATTETLQWLENEKLKVEILSNGVIRAVDKKNNHEWKTFAAAIQDETVIDEGKLWSRRERAMGEQYPARFAGKKEGDNFRFVVYDRQHLQRGTFLCRYTLEKEWLVFQLLEADDSLPSLVFPPPFESESLILPIEGGQWLKNDEVNIFQRMYLQFFSSLGMRFFAGLRGEKGWLCAFDVNTADAGAMLVNGQIAPAWVRSMGQWKSHYRVQYCFTGGGYVGIAKQYRCYALEKGMLKTLREKREENPEVDKMLGGRALQFMNLYGPGYETSRDEYWIKESDFEAWRKKNLNFTFRQVLDKVNLAREKMGFKKGMILLRGWMHGGMDSTHPDIWPPDPELGTIGELKAIMDLRHEYITALHDNYQDFYPLTPSFPKGVIVRKDGTLMSGGLWANGHQCYMTNSRDSVRYARRNWEYVKTLNPSGYFVDTTACNALYESYEKGNEQTRLQDMQYKYELLKIFYDNHLLVGSENFGDFVVPVIHWFEHRQKRKEGTTIPLWQLVFHDCAFTSRYDVFCPETPYPSWLEDMLYGNFLRFWVPREFGEGKSYRTDHTTGWGNWHYTDEEFKNSYHVDEWHALTGMEEMTSHRFLTEDKKVEEAIYGNRYRIVVNFDHRQREVEGIKLKAYDYYIEK